MKSGFVSIVGRPNVGKSTLINRLVNRKIAITSDKVGTTRNNIFGIYNEKDTQIIFIDTPGIQKSFNKLGETLNKKAYSSIENDLVLFVIDISSGFGKNDQRILEKLKQENKDVILILNKVDKMDKEKLLKEITNIKDLYSFKEIIPMSSLKDKTVDNLIETIKKYLKDDIKYFSDDVITNVSEKFMISEIIREKVLMLTKEEVPHAITTLVEKIEFKKNKAYINALIVVERDNLKKIIIGKQGTMLKKIGQLSRIEIEELLDKKVYLELYVKTIENWRDKENLFEYLGITENDE